MSRAQKSDPAQDYRENPTFSSLWAPSYKGLTRTLSPCRSNGDNYFGSQVLRHCVGEGKGCLPVHSNPGFSVGLSFLAREIVTGRSLPLRLAVGSQVRVGVELPGSPAHAASLGPHLQGRRNTPISCRRRRYPSSPRSAAPTLTCMGTPSCPECFVLASWREAQTPARSALGSWLVL